MIYCQRCRKVMKHIQTLGGEYESFQRIVYACNRCKVRCAVEKQYYDDADFKAETHCEQQK